MRGERRKRLRDRLLVADVREHATHHGHAAATRRRDLETRRAHEHQQAHRPEGHGLTAGVGPGDDEHAEVRAEAYVDRHDARSALDEQRMPRADEIQPAVRVEHRPLALEMLGELRLREQQVDRGERVDHHIEILSRPLDAA